MENEIDRRHHFSHGILQFAGLITIAISIVLVFMVPPKLFSLVITSGVSFAVLLFFLNYRKLRFFIIVAFVEHIFIVVALSAIVYTKPPIKKDLNRATMTVEFSSPQKQRKKLQSMPQATMPNIKTPPLKTKSAVSKYLSSSENDVISSIPTRSRSYKLSAGGLATGKFDKLTDQTTGERLDSGLKNTRMSQKPGEYSSSPQIGLPSKGGRPSSQGRVGPMTSGRVATSSSLESSNRVQKGGGLFQITGEVKGRRVTHWPDVPEVQGREVGVVVLTFWVNPEGEVSSVLIKRKAGDPLLEKKAKQFVEQIRFARLPKGVEQRLQMGEITIDFTKDLKR